MVMRSKKRRLASFWASTRAATRFTWRELHPLYACLQLTFSSSKLSQTNGWQDTRPVESIKDAVASSTKKLGRVSYILQHLRFCLSICDPGSRSLAFTQSLRYWRWIRLCWSAQRCAPSTSSDTAIIYTNNQLPGRSLKNKKTRANWSLSVYPISDHKAG